MTFVRFFLSPLKDIGTAFSEFMRALLIDLPVTLYPVAIVTLSMFFFLFLFMWFGYSIRLPFWVSIEPSPVVMVAGSATDNTQAIDDVKKQVRSLNYNNYKSWEENIAYYDFHLFAFSLFFNKMPMSTTTNRYEIILFLSLHLNCNKC